MQFIRCRRRGLLTGTAALIVASVLPARAAEADSPVRPIQQLVDGLLRIMKAGTGTPFPQRFEMLAPVIDRSFDIGTILGESIGPTWSSLSPDQQAMLLQAFRRYTVASYVNSFDRYEGQRFEVQPETRPVANGRQVVMTRIIPRSGDSHELDYVMLQGNGGWRAVDVLADGAVSRVAVQRSDFRRLIARGGPQALASSLSNKSADLSDGTS